MTHEKNCCYLKYAFIVACVFGLGCLSYLLWETHTQKHACVVAVKGESSQKLIADRASWSVSFRAKTSRSQLEAFEIYQKDKELIIQHLLSKGFARGQIVFEQPEQNVYNALLDIEKDEILSEELFSNGKLRPGQKTIKTYAFKNSVSLNSSDVADFVAKTVDVKEYLIKAGASIDNPSWHGGRIEYTVSTQEQEKYKAVLYTQAYQNALLCVKKLAKDTKTSTFNIRQFKQDMLTLYGDNNDRYNHSKSLHKKLHMTCSLEAVFYK